MVSTHAEVSQKSFIDAADEKLKEIEKQFSMNTKVAKLAQEESFYSCRMPSAER